MHGCQKPREDVHRFQVASEGLAGGDDRIEELRRPTANQSRNLQSIVDRVRPSVEGLLTTGAHRDIDALVAEGVRLNIRASADHLRHGSQILEQLIQEDGLLVVGAEYSLETGVVDFFDGVP